MSLSPQASGARRRSARRRRRGAAAQPAPGRRGRGGRVYLQITGVAANDEALTDLLDRLFASSWFASPSLPSERQRGRAASASRSASPTCRRAAAAAAAGGAAPAAEPRPTLIEGAPARPLQPEAVAMRRL